MLALTISASDTSYLLSEGLKLVSLVISGFIVPVVLPKLPSLTARFFDWLSASAGHANNQFVAGVLQRLSTMVEQKVLAYENTEIEFLKEQAAAGKITKDNIPGLLAKMKEDLLAEVKQDATAHGLWDVSTKLFAGNEAALSVWLSGMVETHVAALPPSGLQTKI